MQSVSKSFQLRVVSASGHTYLVASASIQEDGSIAITGSVDGIGCSTVVSGSEISQAFITGGISAVENIIAPAMLKAVFIPTMLVGLGSFSQ